MEGPRSAVWRAARRLIAVGALAVMSACTSAGEGSSTTTGDAPTTTATTTTTTPTTAVGSLPQAVGAEVDRLVVRARDASLPPYRRAAFGDGWDYDPTTGCNTRELVLIEESLVPVTFGTSRCHPERGRWRSAYDGLTTTDPDDLQIDHVVPLADAWRSGAASWTAAQREAFANDLRHPEVLAAVSSHTNLSKGDDAPDGWLPPDRGAWCSYASDWVAVKSTYRLSVTPAEKAALVQVLQGC